ncbi:anhydro-N-acetylmuramic acid kinase [Paenibacillus sp. 598K]|uniref:anhydro-N-acetylmuramic acid kinase n=1 Tax=Paenibacillus sp. 598K TaxID=1117987 RepID=UPI000FFAA5CF|nr:anhydro-N-acetylmuramic acid kinase [Paenibacillus sp. 598K]GBF74110.1 anhydro-N-acetylmuramic acid kinase [Paenibacillus sp. 598K]
MKMSWSSERPFQIGVGLMSGTSLDGIDAAVVQLAGSGANTEVQLLHYATLPYTEELRAQLKQLCSPGAADVAALAGMNVYLGQLFADSALSAVEAAGLAVAEIDFISSHGQTIWHMPEREGLYKPSATLQIGDLSVIAKHTGLPVVGDFRPADMAVGGQGAPLVPYGDLILFGDPRRGRLLQNIGGIGNCTVIPAGAGADDLLAFDTGPGNMIIDQVVHTLTDGRLAYDEGGQWAAEGAVDEALLAELLGHPYFALAPPKSTGRELFGADYALRVLDLAAERGLSGVDTIATVTALTASSIADACRRFVMPRCRVDEVIVSGGGAHNRTLMVQLARLLPEQQVRRAGELGMPDDAKEAVIFALLGHAFLQGVPNNIPAATGAARPTIMGKLALP